MVWAIQEAAGSINEYAKQAATQAMKEVGEASYDKAKTIALSRLNTTAEQYINALEFTQIGPGIWVVGLLEEAEHLEKGYPGFDMRPGLLKNAKKTSKLGYKYRSIPMAQKSTGKGKAGTTSGDMRNDLKKLRSIFGDKGTTKGPDGKALLGKVLSFKRDSVGRWNMVGHQPGMENKDTGQIAMSEGSEYGKNLSGVTKYQYKGKGGRVSSQFIVWRTVSENPKYKDSWQHPGFNGIHAFEELNDFAYSTLEKKLREIFGA